MKYRYKFIIIVCMTVISCLIAEADKVSLKARLDSAHLIMGRQTTLHLEVVKDQDVTGYFPLFANSDNRPYAGLLGDSIELSKNFDSDTVSLGSGRMQINYHVPLQAFDSGFYFLPEIEYVAGVDTAVSNRVSLKVLPINVDPNDNIEGFTDIVDAPKGKWTDKVPDFLIDYWWLILIILLLLAAGVGIYIHYKRTGRILPRIKPQLSPYEIAQKRLEALKSKHLWQEGKTEDYFVELTDILRSYIDKRFKVSAPEMTTQQFIVAASENEKLAGHAPELHRLLELADFVKFARGQALPDENNEAFAIVQKFVEDTKPSEEEEANRKAEEVEQLRLSIQRKNTFKRNQKANNSKDRSKGKRSRKGQAAGKEVKK